MKLCNKCNQLLPLDSFNNASGGNYLRPECKNCNKELEKIRKKLREQFGMPKDNYVCPICLDTESDVRKRGRRKQGPWVLDHCHTTHTFRGWLCHKCNMALGGFNDDKNVLQRAIDYLTKGEKQDDNSS